MNNKIVSIEWVDSTEYEDSAWKSEKEVQELQPVKIKSAGILVQDSDLYITLASSINDSEDPPQYGGLISIPKSSIRIAYSLKQYDFLKELVHE